MGFFARLAQLIKSNINDLIHRAEDPEKMLVQVLQDMSQQLVEAKKQVAIAIADEKKLRKQLENEQAQAEQWEEKAKMAVRAGDDALAKEALSRKKEHDLLAAQFHEQWRKQLQAVEQLKLALRALNDKIEEAKRKKGVLISRKRRAEAMKSIQETMSGLRDASAFDTFDRMAERIDQLEAEAEAGAEMAEEASGDVLRHKFRQLEQTAGADEELARLKQSMGMGSEAAAPAVATRVEEPSESERDMAELEEALEELKKRELTSSD